MCKLKYISIFYFYFRNYNGDWGLGIGGWGFGGWGGTRWKV